MAAADFEPPPVLSFSEAYCAATRTDEQSAGSSRLPHLLLGNGFSLACQPQTFAYSSLFDQADFGDYSLTVRAVFDEFNTRDFERIVNLIQSSEKIISVLETTDEALVECLREMSQAIRDGLVAVLTDVHPGSRSDISTDQYESAHMFLSKFSRIFTLNYDLLLYWTIVRHLNEHYRKDGFSITSGSYRLWDPSTSSVDFYFLHGALHLYNTEGGVGKTTWADTGVQLVEQTRQGLDEGRFPLVVTEGTSKDKEEKIHSNRYLSRAIDEFANLEGALFTYGFSMSENDQHILDRIARGRLARVFVSIYGEPESENRAKSIEKGERLAAQRCQSSPNGPPLEVCFYEAGTAHIWRTDG